MAIDASDPQNTDTVIFNDGIIVQVCVGLTSDRMENWVRQVAEKSGQPVDWHYSGGRAVVKTTGNIALVALAMEELTEEYQRLARETMEEHCEAD